MKALIIGGGAVSETWHIPAAIKLLGAGNIVVAEPDHERQHHLKNVFGIHRIESNFKNVLKSVDMAIVATPPHLHPSMTIDCLKSQVPVLCEKPFSNTIEECDSILKTAEETKTFLGVCHNYRFFPNRAFIREQIKAGYFGKKVLIDIQEGGVASWPAQSGYTFRKELVSGGVLLNNGIHSLDFILWCFGKPIEIEYYDDSIGGLESNAEVRMTFNNGCKGRLKISRTCQMANKIWVKGDASAAHISTFEMNRVLNRNGSEQWIDEYNGRTIKDFSELAVNQLKEFIGAAKSGKNQFCSGEEGTSVIAAIEHCYKLKKHRPCPETTPIPGIMW